jgi:aspartate racemase
VTTLGIVGGIGPESTVEYYRAILAAYRERHGHASAPSIVINSIDVNKLLALMGGGDLPAVTSYLVDEVRRLADAGAAVGLLAANTPHVVFDDVQRQSPIPLVSIVAATRARVEAIGWTRVGLLGTRFTMGGRFYADEFARAGIDIVAPADDEQAYIHEKYTTELLRNVFLPDTNAGLLRIIARMKDRHGIQAVILGGTELPLILRDAEAYGLPLLDTTQIHARAAVERLWP